MYIIILINISTLEVLYIMSVCCYDLLSLKYFQNIKLVAGNKGLYRHVTWPFICTTPTVSQWLHGGELLFITGAGIPTDDTSLETLMKDCIAKELTGIVIVTGNQYIQTISPNLIDLAEKSDFPLFEMSWNIKLIDVTQEISELIMENKEGFKQSQRFLERLLFSDNETENFDKLSSLYGIPYKPYRFIVVINVEPTEETNYILGFAKNDIVRSLSNLCKDKTMTLVSMNLNNNIICFASADSPKYIQYLDNAITTAFSILITRYNKIDMWLGFGRVYGEGEDSKIQTSFREASRAIKLMKREICSGNILHYCDLGFYKLLYEIKNIDEIQSYYTKNIGCLMESDKKDSTELLFTLRCYLNNNCNLVNTARDLYIHRNTLVYRLNVIKKLIQKDLNDSLVRLELYNSILAYDFVEK